MASFFHRITTFYQIIKNKIAFYPTLLSLIGFTFALLMISFENNGFSRKLIDVLPMLVVEDGATALTVLSTCIAGLISMMVFSFSMVMLLLSQASSNFSPRLLPGLISNKEHQIILGIYLATIIYNIFTLFSIEASEEKFTLPGFSILLGVIFSIVCLSAFIFFIHNISQSIQINHIMEGIHAQATIKLTSIISKEKENNNPQLIRDFPDTSTWHYYISPLNGYLQNIALNNINEICKENDNRIYIAVPKGLFVLKNVPILKSEKPLSEKVVNAILSNINFARGEYIHDNYVLAFKQLTEVAVKAMSPGINDPGTALNAIDYLTELFALRLSKNDSGVWVNEEKALIKVAVVPFKELLYNVMASLRTYCNHDPIVVQKLVWMLHYLKQQPCKDVSYEKAIEEELHILMEGLAFESKRDLQKMKDLIEEINFTS